MVSDEFPNRCIRMYIYQFVSHKSIHIAQISRKALISKSIRKLIGFGQVWGDRKSIKAKILSSNYLPASANWNVHRQ